MKPDERKIQKLNEYPSYMGGDTCLHSGGYVFEYLPTHALANSWGWVAQHRLVAETILGRPLIRSRDSSKREVAHHVNHIKTDNRMENIQVMIASAHYAYHARHTADESLRLLNDNVVLDALKGRTIREAACFLGTTHMTLRRRFSHLITDRKRRTPADVDDPKWPDLIRPLASDPKVTIRDAVKLLNISAVPIRRICQKNGIVWMQNSSRKDGGYGRPKGSKVLDITDTKWPDLVRPLAADSNVTMKEAASMLGVGESQLRNIRAYHGIEWINADQHKSTLQRSRGLSIPS